MVMKIQTGIRLTKDLWDSYKKLCESEGYRPNEAIEQFLEVCSRKNSVKTVLELLKSESEGQKLADKLKLENLLVDLEVYLEWDKQKNQINYSDICNDRINEIIKVLPRIHEKTLLEKAEAKIREVLSYYREAMKKA